MNILKLYPLIAFVVCVLVISTASAQDTLRLRNYFRELKMLSISIAGQDYQFLFDTGGGESFISPAIAKRLGKEPYLIDLPGKKVWSD